MYKQIVLVQFVMYYCHFNKAFNDEKDIQQTSVRSGCCVADNAVRATLSLARATRHASYHPLDSKAK
jgi:hypothetical protein